MGRGSAVRGTAGRVSNNQQESINIDNGIISDDRARKKV